MDVTARDVATWMLVGFQKQWRWRDVMAALGLRIDRDHDIETLHRVAPFAPGHRLHVLRPVRAYVAQEWPKLYAYLLQHEGIPDKMLATVDQIVRLKWSGKRAAKGQGKLSLDDIKEAQRNHKRIRNLEAGNQALNAGRQSSSRAAWNTCKGTGRNR